jgi:hypothetical protein
MIIKYNSSKNYQLCQLNQIDNIYPIYYHCKVTNTIS